MEHIKTCNSLEEVREQIDKIDAQLVALVCTRQQYVMQAVGFKRDRTEARVPARIEQIIARVRSMAEAQGGSPDVLERLYREMIDAFIELESNVLPEA